MERIEWLMSQVLSSSAVSPAGFVGHLLQWVEHVCSRGHEFAFVPLRLLATLAQDGRVANMVQHGCMEEEEEGGEALAPAFPQRILLFHPLLPPPPSSLLSCPIVFCL